MALQPAIIRKRVRVAAGSDEEFVLEDLLGNNTPLLFPIVSFLVLADSDDVSILVERGVLTTGSVDPDFDGSFTETVLNASLTGGASTSLTVSPRSLGPTEHGVEHGVTIEATGTDPALVLVLVQGLVESAIEADPNLVVNI